MPSSVLYPPVIDAYQNAFMISKQGDKYKGTCKVLFSLSKVSAAMRDEIKQVHISVLKQSSNMSVVSKDKNAAGIILTNFTSIGNNLYSVDITDDWINGGWSLGTIYKIQLRFSSVIYDESSGESFFAWMTKNSSNFSEWSTYSITKAIGQDIISFPTLGYSSDSYTYNSNKITYLYTSSSTLEMIGSYKNNDDSEKIYSYQFYLYDELSKEIEKSNIIYQKSSDSQIYYLFKTELENNRKYKIRFEYQTNNKYENYKEFYLNYNMILEDIPMVNLLTVDSITEKIHGIKTNLGYDVFLEEEEGRIGIKLYTESDNRISQNFCIRRSDNRDNFKTWQDIKVIVCNQQSPNEIPIFYDYLIESGVQYKYGIQTINSYGGRSPLREFGPFKRDFEYSYLLGPDGRQLKLKFDNTINSFTHTVLDSKTDTIGGKFPSITRNGYVNYRTFPITGLISLHMDEQELFLNQNKLFQIENIKNNYNYDNIYYERLFREKVLEFLYDGKIKLFKSPTEGNIFVRLMDVSCSPNQTLSRMIYSFSATAFEMGEFNLYNAINKFNFLSIDKYSTDFETKKTKFGHLNININSDSFVNIINIIKEKYGNGIYNLAGSRETLSNIKDLTISFEGRPYWIEEIRDVGYKISLDGNSIIVYADSQYPIYRIDSTIPSDAVLNIYNEDINTGMEISLDFIYEVVSQKYVDRQILSQSLYNNVGQLHDYYQPNTSLFNEIYNKYYYDAGTGARRATNIVGTCIEAPPGAVFYIQDEADYIIDNTTLTNTRKEARYHIINHTGVLDLSVISPIYDIEYIGMYYGEKTEDGEKIIQDVSTDIIFDYIVGLSTITYNE